MFIAHNQVRMHDTDMAGILYFANQFRFVHDALEDIFSVEGYTFDNLFQEQEFIFVIVHVEADYLAPLKVSDKLEIHISIEKIGNSSMTMLYHIYRDNHELVGTAKTVQVCLNRESRSKITIPDVVRQKFAKYLLAAQGTT